ncbi:MAG: hypothetical protein SVR94_11815 [Pseudomonadota bacterium]|nr:hypothetical protein [Pseudomonadota bacterium]
MFYSKYAEQPIATLESALRYYTVEQLKKLVALLKPATTPQRKEELVQLIKTTLFSDAVETLWEQLDELQKAAVAEAVHGADAYFYAERFKAKYGQLPSWGQTNKVVVNYIETPSLLQLFFCDGVIPTDFKQRLKRFVAQPKPTLLKSQQDIPAVHTVVEPQYSWQRDQKPTRHELALFCRHTEHSARCELLAVLRFIEAGKLMVSDKTRHPTSATLKAMNALLLEGDFYNPEHPRKHEQGYELEDIGPIKTFAWSLLVQAGGLAELGGKRLQLTKNGQKALTSPPEKTLATLWKRWLKTKLLDELRRIHHIKGQHKRKNTLTDVTKRRSLINQALALCPPHQWVNIDDFFRYMLATDMTFEVTHNAWDLYLLDAHYGSLGHEGFGDWSILQGRYILCLLFEYAAPLGLIDVAYTDPYRARWDFQELWGADELDFLSRYDGFIYFRVNALGAYCLGLSAHYQPLEVKPQSVLKVLPNLDIVAPDTHLTPADTFVLDSYTVKVSDRVWKLDQDLLLKAAESGYKIVELQKFLEARTTHPLPETVHQFLNDMSQRSNSLQNQGSALLIECGDAALATLIAHHQKTKTYCLLAGERHLAVPSLLETKFRNALRKLGYTLPK